jgi:hypothetical protein
LIAFLSAALSSLVSTLGRILFKLGNLTKRSRLRAIYKAHKHARNAAGLHSAQGSDDPSKPASGGKAEQDGGGGPTKTKPLWKQVQSSARLVRETAQTARTHVAQTVQTVRPHAEQTLTTVRTQTVQTAQTLRTNVERTVQTVRTHGWRASPLKFTRSPEGSEVTVPPPSPPPSPPAEKDARGVILTVKHSFNPPEVRVRARAQAREEPRLQRPRSLAIGSRTISGSCG